MTPEELGHELKTIYDTEKEAQAGEVVARVVLFGIQHADDVDFWGGQDIVRAAGISLQYGSHLTLGARLAKYVTVD